VGFEFDQHIDFQILQTVPGESMWLNFLATISNYLYTYCAEWIFDYFFITLPITINCLTTGLALAMYIAKIRGEN